MIQFVTRLVLPPEDSGRWDDVPDLPLLGQLLGEFHRSARGSCFAIAFPEWMDSSGKTLGTFGRSCDLFAEDRAALEKILDATKVRRLVRDHCSASAIITVPRGLIDGYARFCRARRHDRGSSSAIRRMIGNTQTGVPPQSLTGRVRALAADGLPVAAIHARLEHCPGTPHFHYLTTNTGQQAQLAIVRHAADGPGPFEFTSFGLSRGGAVPLLKPVPRK